MIITDDDRPYRDWFCCLLWPALDDLLELVLGGRWGMRGWRESFGDLWLLIKESVTLSIDPLNGIDSKLNYLLF